jgi:hypothetical protein
MSWPFRFSVKYESLNFGVGTAANRADPRLHKAKICVPPDDSLVGMKPNGILSKLIVYEFC